MSGAMPPSYPWYPRDFMADEPVMLMTLEQEGAYRRLLDHQWLHGSIPSDFKQLAVICKSVTAAKMKALWTGIAECFVVVPDDDTRLINERLERVREEYVRFHAGRSAAGSKGNEVRWKNHRKRIAKGSLSDRTATDLRVANTSPSLAPSLAPATTTAVAVVVTDDTTAIRGWDDFLGAVPSDYRNAVDGALRAASDPDALRRQLVAMHEAITGGAAYSPAVIGQAIHELAVAGSRVTAAGLRAFCRRIAAGERETTATTDAAAAWANALKGAA